MNWNHIVTVYLKELRDSLRDRRTLISTIVIPTLVMPALMFGVGTVMTEGHASRPATKPTSLVVVGGADSPRLVAALKADEEVPDRRGRTKISRR